jgi:hypothetical protein
MKKHATRVPDLTNSAYAHMYVGVRHLLATGVLVGHTPRVPTNKEEGGLLLEFLCNPTRTCIV